MLLVSILVVQFGVLFLMSEGVKINQLHVLRLHMALMFIYAVLHTFYGVR